MELIAGIAAFGMTAVGLVLFLVQTVAREIGYRLGRSHATQATEERQGTDVVAATMLGLLSFVLAISIGNTTTQFEQGRAVALNEAKAIGTAWLRTEPIDDPRSVRIREIIEGYARLRADFVAAPADGPALEVLEHQTGVMQQEIWRAFVPLMRQAANPATANLEVALNQMFEAAAATRFALFTPYAGRLFWLLMSMAMVAMVGLGYQLGLKGRPVHVLASLLTLMWTMVIVSILDEGAARHGTMRMNAAPYEWTIQGFRPLRNG